MGTGMSGIRITAAVSLQQRDFQGRLFHEVRGGNTGVASADDNYVHGQIAIQRIDRGFYTFVLSDRLSWHHWFNS